MNHLLFDVVHWSIQLIISLLMTARLSTELETYVLPTYQFLDSYGDPDSIVLVLMLRPTETAH